MSARRWSVHLGWLLDFIALGTLAATMEIPTAALAVIPAALAFRFARKLRPSDFGMLLLLGGIVLGGLISWLYLKFPPITTVACVAPVFHAALWLAPENSTYKGWRIGMGFVDLILASALTNEAFLSAAICFFVVLGSVALSCNFLERKIGEESIPANFIRSSGLIALLVFPISAAIFPFLPRMSEGAKLGFGSTETHVGYSEEVSLSNWSRLTEERGSKPVLWLYPESKVDLALEMYQGLLRGRTLELFDSVRWKPAVGRFTPTRTAAQIPASHKFDRSISVDVVLDSLGSSILPAPYGTYAIAPSNEDTFFPVRRLRSSEWLGERSEGRTHYSFLFAPSLYWFDRSALERDLPIPAIHLQVPAILNNDRMKNLAKTIFAGATTEREKISRLLDFFRKEKFQATLNDSEGESPHADGATKLEHFLFTSRRGHCEWFASATAVLLRMGGVPTRLVAGFRLQQRSSDEGGAVVVRGNDAHAWVEAYTPERGWIPIDPTPRILKVGSLLNTLLDGYDTVSAFWFRYVLTYSSRSSGSWRAQLFHSGEVAGGLSGFQARVHQELSQHWQAIGMALGLGLTLIAAIYFWIRLRFPWILSIRYRVREGSPALRRERLLMEKWARDRRLEGDLFSMPLAESASKWRELYLKTRFGGPEDRETQAAALGRLRELRREAESLH